MRRKAKLFIIYFPVLMVSSQVAVNLLYFIWYDGYISAAFYLNHFFGVNMMFGIFMVAFVHWFKFCTISRFSAWAELLFGVNFLVVQQDNLYNILFQVIVGSVAIAATLVYYARKYPLCSLSLLMSFISSMFTTRSCEDAFRKWDDKTESKVHQKLFSHRHEYK